MRTPYDTDVGTIWADLGEVQSNVSYMCLELANVPLSEELKPELVGVLYEFDSLLHDLRAEARNLEDKLGMHPGEEPNDPNIVNPDPRVTLGFLSEWPKESFLMLDAVVRKLEQVAQRDMTAGSAYILVAESAVNVLKAHTEMLDAVERIRATLEKAGR